MARKRRPGRPRKDDHLDRRAAEIALAERMAELTRELAADHEDLDDDLAACVVPAQRGGAAA